MKRLKATITNIKYLAGELVLTVNDHGEVPQEFEAGDVVDITCGEYVDSMKEQDLERQQAEQRMQAIIDQAVIDHNAATGENLVRMTLTEELTAWNSAEESLKWKRLEGYLNNMLLYSELSSDNAFNNRLYLAMNAFKEGDRSEELYAKILRLRSEKP